MLDAPRGAVWLGGRFAELGRSHLVQSGLLAQAFGYVALGRPDSARASLDQLLTRLPNRELARFAAEFMGAVAFLDSGAVSPAALSPRAEAMFAVLSGRSPAEPGDLDGLLQALALGREGRWSDALARTDALADSLVADSARRHGSHILAAVLHLTRADWYARLGNPEAARRELRWAEHWEVVGFPKEGPQAAEVDWSLRTLARWRLATVMDAAGLAGQPEDRLEVCLAYRRVANAWADGTAPFRARADSAQRRAVQLRCPPGR
jgi:hypothetical protein